MKADIDLKTYREKLNELGVPVGGDGAAKADCKGIMVIGTYRKTPISDRNEPGFPDPVARTINRTEICALSGLQLLDLLLLSREDPAKKETILVGLFATNGVLTKSRGWTEFLEASKNLPDA